MTEQPKGTKPLSHSAQNQCFGCGPGSPVGLRLEFAVDEDATVICDAVISNNYEGPPGYVHGGIIATLLDEAMSKANRARGVTAMTRQMQVDYLHPVHSGKPIRLVARVTSSEGRKHWTSAELLSSEGVCLAKATGLFIAIRPRVASPDQN